MGSPCSSLVANVYMEVFEKRALDFVPHRHAYGSDTSMILFA